jgi:ATP-dependent DNA ligase
VLCSSTFIPPCEPILRDRLPKGEGWLYEVKHDGYRVQVHKVGSRVVLYSRNGHDFTDRFPSIAQLLRELPAASVSLYTWRASLRGDLRTHLETRTGDARRRARYGC